MSGGERSWAQAVDGPGAYTDGELSTFLSQIGHSLQMTEALPSHIGDEALTTCERDACADAFYVHASLLGHFFLSSAHDRMAGDLVARDYLPQWELDRRTAKRFRSLCDFASVHVVRASRARLDEPVVEIDLDDVREVRHLVVESSRRFTRQLAGRGRHEDARTMSVFLDATGDGSDSDPVGLPS